MITVSEHIPDFDTYAAALDYAPQDSLFFDIETTGFSPASSLVFLIGTVFYENGSWKLTQYLAEDPSEEKMVLNAFLDLAGRFTFLVHFNGSTFDLPYLIRRAQSLRIPQQLDRKQSLDLYQKFRPLRSLLGLEHMNQSSLETALGWQRRDRLTGKHMVTLFHKFAASKEPGLQELLLLHNHDDMLGMTRILPLAALLLLFKGEVSDILSAEPVLSGSEFSGQILQICFRLSFPVPLPVSLSRNYGLSVWENQGTVSVPVFEGTLCHFFPDYRNYYYLPLEDQAIHKSVASYVDKAYREPAKASNCYIKKSGLFLPQPKELFTPAFKCSLDARELYFPFSDDFLTEKDRLNVYLSSLLHSFC